MSVYRPLFTPPLFLMICRPHQKLGRTHHFFNTLTISSRPLRRLLLQANEREFTSRRIYPMCLLQSIIHCPCVNRGNHSLIRQRTTLYKYSSTSNTLPYCFIQLRSHPLIVASLVHTYRLPWQLQMHHDFQSISKLEYILQALPSLSATQPSPKVPPP